MRTASTRDLLRRRWPAIAAWGLAGPPLIWAVGRLFGLERGTPLVQLMAFTPYVAGVALLPVVAAVVLRRWWAAVAAGLAWVVLIGCVAPRAIGGPDDATGVPVTIMSANLRVGGADAGTIVDLVRSSRADILVLQEFNPTAHSGLTAAGLDELLPHAETHALEGTIGSAVYSRFPLTDAGVRVNEGGFRQAYGQVEVPGAAPLLVVSVHPAAPGNVAAVPLWVADLRAQPVPEGRQLVLAGDFNATLDHAELRRLLGAGYRDAATSLGRGLITTWPYDGPRTLVTPRITLDHVLVGPGIGVRDFGAYEVPNTDHRAVLARIVLAASV